MRNKQFIPVHRVLMGPGPSDVPVRVLHAMARPTIGHLDPQFIELMDRIKALLQFGFQTKNELTLPVSAPGSAGMETCFVNLLEPGDKVIICVNGVFGKRMVENAVRLGAIPVVVDDEWGTAVSLDKVEVALTDNPDAAVLAFVHAETSTGVLSDAKALCELAAKHNCLTIVDAVTSFGGVELDVDAWGIDAIYTGTQKCLSAAPGISPVSFNERAAKKIKGRKVPVQSWFLDLNLVMGYWGGSTKRAYHHTAPINALYGLHESLLMLEEEGLQNAWQRHAFHHKALKAGLDALGLSFTVDATCRTPQLNSIRVPDGVDEAAVRAFVLNRFSLEIGAGLGALAGKVWRIGLMGQSACRGNVVLCLEALDSALQQQGFSHGAGEGVAAAELVYSQ
ncbi:MAG: alanine--glyoxylate aminotransferase family protein [Gammaproteobacteria bacterium]|nr:alanine--glyoxylate aminotransferase family protein [Gammaproteobacteria bacterium]